MRDDRPIAKVCRQPFLHMCLACSATVRVQRGRSATCAAASAGAVAIGVERLTMLMNMLLLIHRGAYSANTGKAISLLNSAAEYAKLSIGRSRGVRICILQR